MIKGTFGDLVLELERVDAIAFGRGEDGQIEGAKIWLATGQEIWATAAEAKALAERYEVDSGTTATTSDRSI